MNPCIGKWAAALLLGLLLFGVAAEAAESKPEKAAPAGRCTGKATFCAVYSRTFCSSQPGCAFLFGANMCGGVPPKCETATTAAYCGKIKGCSWK